MITSANTHRGEDCNHCRLTSPSQETITLTIVTSAVRTKPTVLIKQTFASPLSPLSPLFSSGRSSSSSFVNSIVKATNFAESQASIRS
ncbi:hypothetical protein HanRHA438_Chr14g0655331 [Helianthus annuus]|nr:hypothetical protein HanRHA438_Chr14g0655331 [Helianthus annuus]